MYSDETLRKSYQSTSNSRHTWTGSTSTTTVTIRIRRSQDRTSTTCLDQLQATIGRCEEVRWDEAFSNDDWAASESISFWTIRWFLRATRSTTCTSAKCTNGGWIARSWWASSTDDITEQYYLQYFDHCSEDAVVAGYLLVGWTRLFSSTNFWWSRSLEFGGTFCRRWLIVSTLFKVYVPSRMAATRWFLSLRDMKNMTS